MHICPHFPCPHYLPVSHNQVPTHPQYTVYIKCEIHAFFHSHTDNGILLCSSKTEFRLMSINRKLFLCHLKFYLNSVGKDNLLAEIIYNTLMGFWKILDWEQWNVRYLKLHVVGTMDFTTLKVWDVDLCTSRHFNEDKNRSRVARWFAQGSTASWCQSLWNIHPHSLTSCHKDWSNLRRHQSKFHKSQIPFEKSKTMTQW